MNIKYRDGKIYKKIYSCKPGEYYVKKFSDGTKLVKQIEKFEPIFHIENQIK